MAKANSFIDQIYSEIGENDMNQDVNYWLSTGLLPLNKEMSGKYHGGFPGGRITEVYGGPSAGKTLLATMAMIQTQLKGGLAVFLDYEHAFSVSRAIKLGLSTDKDAWIYKQPDTAEAGFRVIEFIANILAKTKTERIVTVVIDSVASMMTQKEMETGYGDENMRTRQDLPIVMSSSLKKLAKTASQNNMTLIFLNQTRDNIGVMFGDKEKTPGGNALKFYASLRLRLGKAGKVKDGEEVVAEKVKATTVKNKVFEPFKQTEYLTSFTYGIDLVRTHFEELVSMGVIEKSGAWFTIEGQRYQGATNAIEAVKADPALYERLLENFKDDLPKAA